MEQHLQIIYQAIDRGVQKGIYTAQEVYSILHAYESVALELLPSKVIEPKIEKTAE